MNSSVTSSQPKLLWEGVQCTSPCPSLTFTAERLHWNGWDETRRMKCSSHPQAWGQGWPRFNPWGMNCERDSRRKLPRWYRGLVGRPWTKAMELPLPLSPYCDFRFIAFSNIVPSDFWGAPCKAYQSLMSISALFALILGNVLPKFMLPGFQDQCLGQWLTLPCLWTCLLQLADLSHCSWGVQVDRPVQNRLGQCPAPQPW